MKTLNKTDLLLIQGGDVTVYKFIGTDGLGICVQGKVDTKVLPTVSPSYALAQAFFDTVPNRTVAEIAASVPGCELQ